MASSGTYTNAYLEKLALLGDNQVGAGNTDAPLMRLGYFKIGEGGSTGGVPNTPDPALTDVEAQGVGINSLYVFQKALAGGDVTAVAGQLTIVCNIGAAEAPGPGGLGGNPIFYELGVFDEDDTMICYLTFDAEEKVPGIPLQHTVKIQYL